MLESERDLAALLASRVPLIALETRDEARALALVVAAARGAQPVFRWTVTEGMTRADVDSGAPQRFNADPGEVLRHIRTTDLPGVYVLVDLHPFLDEPVHVRLLKDIALGYASVPRTVVLLSHEVPVPAELDHLVAPVRVAPLRPADRAAVVDRVLAQTHAATGGRLLVDPHARDLLIANLGGLSSAEVERLARGAVADGALVGGDLPAVMAARYELLARGGVLQYEHEVPDIADVAGMDRLVRWLQVRRAAFDGSADLDPPRGVLLVGVQGCGKSMAAKAAAGVFGVPLLHLDLASVHNKYVGESERILRETLASADVLAPCVVWVDEVEKALADDENGAARRVLGTLLTWLAERRSRAFVVATANDVQALPPELVRKGRFDEMFFVDLPDAHARAHVLRVHAARRGLTLTEADAAALAQRSGGFSGAELEQAVVAARYAAHAGGSGLTTAHVADELAATRPLSVVMAERIAALRAWADGRTVPAAG